VEWLSNSRPRPLEEPDTIAFLSCDSEKATELVNQLVGNEPKAILLYSIDGNCCNVEGEDLSYASFYTRGTRRRRPIR
jgi:hypothetical protein